MDTVRAVICRWDISPKQECGLEPSLYIAMFVIYLLGFWDKVLHLYSQWWPWTTVLVTFSVALMNHSDQKQLVEERVYSVCSYPSSEVEAGTEAETTGNTAYWLATPGLLSHLSYIVQAHQPTVGWALEHQSAIKKMPHRYFFRPGWWR